MLKSAIRYSRYLRKNRKGGFIPPFLLTRICKNVIRAILIKYLKIIVYEKI